MNKCILCEIINNPKYLEDTIIFENELFIIKAAKGMPVSGHLLIIPKKHINGMAELSINELNTLETFIKDIIHKVKKYTNNNVILFEHGSLPEGRHPKSIVHAHLHIIPYNLSNKNIKRIIKDCQLKKISHYSDIKNVKHKDYCFFKDYNDNLYLSHSINFPRSIIFKVIAEQAGLGFDYEWRDEKNNKKELLLETIEMGKTIFKK